MKCRRLLALAGAGAPAALAGCTVGYVGDPGFVRAGGSRWRVGTGRAVDGPLEGTELRQANTHPPLFWFAWLEFHPGTAVWGRD